MTTHMDSKPPETLDLPKLARERVQIGPPASWIASCDYDQQFTPKLRGESTCLLIENQIHAELGQTYVHVATRLESQHAVRSQSQGQINFDPQTQSLVLHSIKTRRGESETEHAYLDRIQFLQREAGLESRIIGGQITLLLLLEDVRPGDILEYSFTVTTRSRLMPEHVTAFFSLPPGTEIGKYYFLIQHAETRALKWKTSSPDLTPQITNDNGVVRCCWTNTNYSSPDPEGCVPPGLLLFPWIQVSDCPDWQTIARALVAAWEKQMPGDAVARMVAEISDFSADPLVRITKAIETVQDEFRYLSVNVELGGQIPAAPDLVIRRRYGDCKDVAFLLVQILRALGLRARPVLVNTYWIKSIGSMLPSPNIFNHAIVEYEIGTEKRWVDGTVKNQGGGALNRCLPDFGFGLPLDAETSELAPVPQASLIPGSYEVKESLILSTSGANSFLAVVVTRTGAHADAARNEFVNRGIDVVAKDRLQACANRFSKAGRIRPLECRDDRDANEFVMAEAFEVVTPIRVDKGSNTCLFQIRSDITATSLVHPGLAARRYPLALPFPAHWTHTFEIEFGGINGVSLPFFQVGNSFFTFGRRSRSWPNLLKVTFSLETLQGSIPPDKLDEHRKNVEAVHEAGVIHLLLPLGYSASRRRADFGALPAPNPSRAGAGNVVVSTQKPIPAKAEVPVPIAAEEKETVALQKTAELAGMPAVAKPMPPAREAIPLQTTLEPSRPSPRRPRKLEKRCAWAFYLFIFSAVAFLSAMPLARYVSKELAGVVMLFIVTPSWACSLILAIFGWKQTAKYPGRYTDTSKLFATLTLALGGMVGLILVPMHIYSFTRGVDYARMQARRQHVENPPAENPSPEFKDLNFTFHSPGGSWRQVNPSQLAPKIRYELWRPDPMYFTILQQPQRVGVIVMNPRHDMVQASKNTMRRDVPSYRITDEKEVTYNGLAGWQIEAEGTVRDRDTCFVQWIYATNGFGYLLSTWAPRSSKVELEVEASRLFARFELTPPQQVTATPSP